MVYAPVPSTGIYNSYWLRKINNVFIKKGQKKKIIKHMNTSLLLLKFTTNVNPLIYIFEIVDTIKPLFKLINVFPRRIPVVCPKPVAPAKRYAVAVRWIQTYISENKRTASRGTGKLYIHIWTTFTQLATARGNPLIKKRNQYDRKAVILQENMRYTWPKI